MMQSSFKRRHARGYSLLELTLSMALLSIVMVSSGSAMLFAVKAMPDADQPAAHMVRDTKLVARISDDLSQAKYVLESTPQAVTVVVPDRNADGIPDRIRYAWSGTLGDPLTYQFNDSAVATIASAIDAFTLDYTLINTVTTLPDPQIFGSEKLVHSFDNTSGVGYEEVKAACYLGQIALPVLTGSAIGFVPTRLETYIQGSGSDSGVVAMELRDEASGDPGPSLFATATIEEASLPNSLAWYAFALNPQQLMIPSGQSLAMTFSYSAGTGTIAELASGLHALGGMIQSTGQGASWSPQITRRLLHRLYGKEITTSGSDIDVTREHIKTIQIEIQSTGSTASPVRGTARMLQSPEVLDAFWESDFSAAPTTLDLDGDGSPDWAGVIPAGHLVNGVWNAQSTLSVAPDNQFTAPTVVELRMCSASSSNATMTGPLHINSAGDALPVLLVLSDDGSGGQTLFFYNDLIAETPYGMAMGLPAGWVDVKLVMLPDSDVVAVWVEGDFVCSVVCNRSMDSGERGLSLSGDKFGAKFAQVRVTVGGASSP